MIIYGGSFKFWIPSGFNTRFGSHLKEVPPRTWCLLVIGRQLLKGIQYDLRIALGLGPFGGATTFEDPHVSKVLGLDILRIFFETHQYYLIDSDCILIAATIDAFF